MIDDNKHLRLSVLPAALYLVQEGSAATQQLMSMTT